MRFNLYKKLLAVYSDWVIKSFFLIALSCFSSIYGSNWDVEYWQYFNKTNIKCNLFKLYTTGVIRLDKDITRFYYYRISENFSFPATCSLDLEAHYSFIYSKPRGQDSFTTKNRLELEINPHFCFGNGVKWQWRNRLEIVKRQHISELQYLLRERLLATIPFCGGKVFALSFYDEVFYDFDLKKITENRFVPLQMSFGLCVVNIDVFIMVRNFFSSDQWYKSIVIGTDLGF